MNMNEMTAVNQLITTNLNVNKFIEIYFNALLVVQKRYTCAPLHTVGSSKLCRKTHIDISNKAQVNMYAIGLHEVGSSAVEHYSMLEIRDLFTLLCAAFNQPQYRVDKQLNILHDEKNEEDDDSTATV